MLFIGLNSEDTGPQTITTEQADWVEGVLADNEDVRWTMVLLHKPLWLYTEAGSDEMHAMWTRIEGMLTGRKHSVFAGHFHSYTKYERQENNYFVLATTGGGSGLRGPLYGEFDHVVWVTMMDDGPRIANLMLEGIWDENVRTEETAALLGALASGRAIALQPVFSESERFAGASSELRLANDADIPLRIHARFDEHSQASVTPASFDIELPPNSVELIDLEIMTHGETMVSTMGPFVLQWTAEYVDSEPVVPAIDGATRLVVTREFDIQRRTSPVIVDGRLDEGSDLAFDIKSPGDVEGDASSWLNAGDCSWRFSLEMDDTHLYVAVDVTDERQVYKQSSAWTQDGLEFRIDGRSDPARSQNRDESSILMVGISPDRDPDKMGLYQPEVLGQEGVQAMGVPTPTGHAYEISIPLNYIEERQGKDWDKIRINIAVDDYDEETGPLAQLWWQPDWRDQNSFAGSGTFRRAE